MSEIKPFYTTQLQAGLGLVDETKLLLSLYEKDLSANQLYEKALDSGLFPMVSARRLRNIVVECFAPRYIKTGGAEYLKLLAADLSSSAINQLFLIYTATANEILQDFIQKSIGTGIPVAAIRYRRMMPKILSGMRSEKARLRNLGQTLPSNVFHPILLVAVQITGCCLRVADQSALSNLYVSRNPPFSISPISSILMVWVTTR